MEGDDRVAEAFLAGECGEKDERVESFGEDEACVVEALLVVFQKSLRFLQLFKDETWILVLMAERWLLVVEQDFDDAFSSKRSFAFPALSNLVLFTRQEPDQLCTILDERADILALVQNGSHLLGSDVHLL